MADKKTVNSLTIDYWKGKAITKSSWVPMPVTVTLSKEEAWACGLYLTVKDGVKRVKVKARAFVDIHGVYRAQIKGRKPRKSDTYFRGARVVE